MLAGAPAVTDGLPARDAVRHVLIIVGLLAFAAVAWIATIAPCWAQLP